MHGLNDPSTLTPDRQRTKGATPHRTGVYIAVELKYVDIQKTKLSGSDATQPNDSRGPYRNSPGHNRGL